MRIGNIQSNLKDNEIFLTTDLMLINYLTKQNISSYLEPIYVLFMDSQNAHLLSKEEMNIEGLNVIYYSDYEINKQIEVEKTIIKLIEENIKKQIDTIYLNTNSEKIYLFQNFSNMSIIDYSNKCKDIGALKDFEDIKNISKGVEANNKAYDEIKKNISVGMTELDVLNIVEKVFNNEANGFLIKYCDIVSGDRTIEVGGFATNRKIQQGDTLIVDLLPNINSLFSDTTRTFFFGKPTERQIEIYNIIKTILEKTKDYVKPKLKGKEIYNFVYNQLKDYGLESYFPHHAGHCFGISIFEPPIFLPYEEKELEAGMTITIEIGIYLPNEFGIRLEDNYIVKDEGVEKIGNYSLDIENFIIS